MWKRLPRGFFSDLNRSMVNRYTPNKLGLLLCNYIPRVALVLLQGKNVKKCIKTLSNRLNNLSTNSCAKITEPEYCEHSKLFTKNK